MKRPLFTSLGCLLLAGGLLLLTTLAQADETFLGAISLVDDPQVASQLELSEDASAKLKALADARESAAIDLTLSIKDLPSEERQARLAEFRRESERLGFALLTEDQQTKLKQAQVSKAGVQALSDANVAEKLGLSGEQKSKIEGLLAELQKATSQGSEAQRRFARARIERQIADALSQEQRANWDKLTGRLAPDAAIPMATDAPPNNPPAEAPRDFSRSPSRAPTTSGPPQPAPPPAPAVAANARQPAEVDGEANQPEGDKRLQFQFRYAPWKDVLEWFADRADLSLVLDAPPPGTFNYSDRRSYTPAEAIDLLNSVLLTKGYTLIRRERMLMLINLEDDIPPDLVSIIEPSELDKRGEFELVGVHFQLNKMTPEEAETEIRKLIGPQGSVVVLSRARQVKVIETAGKLRAIRSVIEAVENPPPTEDETVAVVELKFTTPSEFLLVARPLLGMPENVNATPDGTLRLAIDELGNRVLVTGKDERIKRLQEIVKLVDVAGPGDLVEGGPVEQPQLEVYSVTSADPTAVLQVMQTLLSGLPDVRLTTDPKTGNLVALAKPSQHATIRATLDQLQRDGTQVEVIKLRRLDPQAAVLAINKLFGVTDQASAANGPKVDADPTSMQLMIRGNAAQVTQIRDLLEKMGETGDDIELPNAERKPIRYLPLTGRAADSALDQITAIWPELHRNKIRIVRPSQSSQGIRARGVPPMDNGEAGNGRVSEAPEIPADAAFDRSTRSWIEDLYAPLDGDRRPRSQPKAADESSPPPGASRDAQPTLNKETSIPRLPGNTYFVAQISGEAGNAASAAAVDPAADRGSTNGGKSVAQPSAGNDTVNDAGEIQPSGRESVPGADIVVTVDSGGITIASADLDALDKLEEMLAQVSDTTASGGREYTVFYLKYARAEVAATLVQEAIGGGMPSDDDGGGSLMGDIASNMLGDAGGGLLGGILGLGGGGGGGGGSSISSSSGVSVIPDPRLNALLVLAKPKDLDMIEQLLQVIDQQASPESVQTVAAPRFIPVLNTSADEIATVVRQVYASRLAADASQPRQPSPEDLIRALRGGRGGGRGGSGQNNRGEEQKMTIGVDTRTNSLIVSAPDYLFQEVKGLVERLDSAVLTSDDTVRVVTLKRANADVVQRSLVSVLGDSVVTNKTGASGSSSSSNSSSSRSSSSRSRSSSSGSSRDQARSVQQQMELFQNIQRSMGGGGSRGGFGGGGFGGSRRGGR